MKAVAAIAGLLIGLSIGLWLADIDHVFPFLIHRSLVTHGAILPGLAYGAYLTTQRKEVWLRMAVVGLFLGMAAHISFDMFPRSWLGYALIHAPFYGRLSPTFSIIWIGANIIACFYLASLMMKEKQEIVFAAVGLAVSFWAYSTGQKNDWSALLLMCGLLAFALALPPRLAVRIMRQPS